jgi:hypothetical protein
VNAYGNTWPLVIPATDKSKCGVDGVSAHEFPSSDGTATVAVDVIYGKDREVDTINKPIVLLGNTAYGLRDHPYVTWELPTKVGDAFHGHIVLIAQTSDLKSIPSLLVRDVEWTPAPVSVPLVKDPTFVSMAVFGTPGAAGPSVIGESGGTTATDDGETVAAGWYALSGTNVDQVSNVKCNDAAKPCMSILNTATPGSDIQVNSDHLHVINSSSILLTLEKAVPEPITLVWKDGAWTSAWSLSLKSDAAAAKLAADPAQLQKGDSRVVHFTGADFTAVTGVKFEDVDLLITSRDKDNNGISVLIPTKATANPGVKQLIALKPTGDPMILTVTVVIP